MNQLDLKKFSRLWNLDGQSQSKANPKCAFGTTIKAFFVF